MSAGPLFFLVIAAIFFVAVVVGLTSWMLVPVAVCVIAAVFWAPILALVQKSSRRRGTGPSNIPTTEESSYEPVADPRDRAAER